MSASLTRPLTAADRAPQAGDVICFTLPPVPLGRPGNEIRTVRFGRWHDEKKNTFTAQYLPEGDPDQENPGGSWYMGGGKYLRANGVYISRADSGPVTVPVSASRDTGGEGAP